MQDLTTEMILTAGVVLLAIVAAWNTLWAGWKNFTEAQEPANTLKKQVEAHADMLDRDNKRLLRLEEGQGLQLRALKELIRHEATGDHLEQLQEVERAIDDHLINR